MGTGGAEAADEVGHTMSIVSVLCDAREPSWIKQLTFGGVPVVSTMLDAGDLLCATDDGCLLAIERKTSSDFLNTLRDNRLFPQLARLHEVSPWAYLIITGTLHSGPHDCTVTEERETGWSWASVAGALLTCQEIGVHVLQVASDMDFEPAIVRLTNRDRTALRIHPVRSTVPMSEAEGILSALPGIGPEKAGAVLSLYPTASHALSYLTCPDRYWEDDKVPGVGDGIKRRVRKALGLEGTSFLTFGSLERAQEIELERSNGK
jgi:ERCC4-type nuclease